MALVHDDPPPDQAQRQPARTVRVALPAESGPDDGKYHTVAGTLLLLLVAGLFMFDRGVALLGVPGLPIFPAEIVLLVGLGFLTIKRHPFTRIQFGRWFAPMLLVVYLGWGLVKVATSLHNPILAVIRDSALVYYALYAVVVIGLSSYDSRFNPKELVRLFGRFVPWFMIVAPIRLIGGTVFMSDGPSMPGNPSVTFFGGHRMGNLGATLGLAVVYLASSGRKDRATIVGIVSGIIMLILIGTQNRGGMLAGAAAIFIAMVVWRRRVKLRFGWVVAVLAAVVVIAWGIDLRIETGGGAREYSVNQLVTNVKSITFGNTTGQGNVNDTIDFRETLWHRVLQRTVETGQLENGWGFGPNLGSSFLPTHEDRDLRNPHNSHMTVLARLGLVGLGIWITLWLSWFYGVLRRARRAMKIRAPVSDHVGRLALLAGTGVAAILVNAYVDPTLETPMVAVVLWSMFGFGVLAVTHDRTERVEQARLAAAAGTHP